MAVIDVNVYSESLFRQITYKAIIPTGELSQFPGGLPTLYLLHGVMGDQTNWIHYTDVIKVANKYNIAVIMPDGGNSFYVDQVERREYYGKFIGEELVRETRKLFPLSKERENTFIGGLSMGGYGALRNGLKYSDTFGAIVGFSSAIIQENMISDPNDHSLLNREFFTAIFGELSAFSESDKNVETLVHRLVEGQKLFPKLYITCGTEDFLIENNRNFHRFLDSLGIEHTYIESPGIHDWNFWNQALEPAMRWLYLLNK